MVYSPYTPVTVSNYNNAPPPDDGSSGSDNQVTWAGIKTKLGDPLNTAIASLNTNVAAAFALRSFRAKSTQASDYTTTADDNGKIIACTSSPTITPGSASDMGEGYSVAVLNVGTGMVLLDGSGSQTINGLNVIELSNLGDFAILMSDGSNYVALVHRSVGQVGMFQYYGGSSTAPNGTLKAAGETIGSSSSLATYKGEKYRTLFNLLKSAGWGNVGTESFDANNTVVLPHGQNKTPIGGGSTYTFGTTGGADTQAGAGTVGGTAVTQANLPSVNFSVSTTMTNDNITNGSFVCRSPSGLPTISEGTGTAHNNVPEGVTTATLSINNSASTGTAASGGSGTTHTHSFTGSATSIVSTYFAGLWVIVY